MCYSCPQCFNLAPPEKAAPLARPHCFKTLRRLALWSDLAWLSSEVWLRSPSPTEAQLYLNFLTA